MTTRIVPFDLSVSNIGTVSIQVLFPNAARQGLWVYNPGAVNTITIASNSTTPQPGAGQVSIPAVAGGAGSIDIAPKTGLVLLQPLWTSGMNAVSNSGINNALTILEF